MIQECYCREKLDASRSQGLKGSTCAKLKPSICSDEGLMLEKSALKLSIVANYDIDLGFDWLFNIVITLSLVF